LWRVR